MKNTANDIVPIMVRMKIKEHKSHYDILQWCQDECGVGQRQAYKYWDEAKGVIKEYVDTMNIDHLTNALVFLETTKSDCMAKGEKALALKYQKEIDSICGLHKNSMQIDSDKPLVVVWGGQNNKDVEKDEDWLNG